MSGQFGRSFHQPTRSQVDEQYSEKENCQGDEHIYHNVRRVDISNWWGVASLRDSEFFTASFAVINVNGD
jgi:hypothetical protein